MKHSSRQLRAGAFKLCRKLASKHDILSEFVTATHANGTVGDMKNLKLLYLATTSRLLPKPVSVAVKGPSSIGKSFEVENTLAFFPKSAYREFTSLSAKALVYLPPGSLKRRMLVFYEAEGMSKDELSHFIRTLLSEGRIKYDTVVSSKGGHHTKHIEQEGPTGLITTTTRAELHEENETRILTIQVVDSPSRTHRILLAQADAVAGAVRGQKPDFRAWRALQTWLTFTGNRVEIPFARSIADLIPPIANRLHRDHPTVLSLIQAHALLHQRNRSRNSSGAIEATLEDYAQVYVLAHDIISEAVEATVPQTIRQTVKVVQRLLKKSPTGVSLASLKRALERDKSSVSRRVQIAVKEGYLKNLQTRAGVSAKLVIGDPMPGERLTLPHPKAVERHYHKHRAPTRKQKGRF